MTARTPYSSTPASVELVYEGHTAVEFDEIKQELNIDFNDDDIKHMHVKWDTLYITFNDGSEVEYEFTNWSSDTVDYKRPSRMTLMTVDGLSISTAEGYGEPLKVDEPNRFELAMLPAIDALLKAKNNTEFKVENNRLYNSAGNRVRLCSLGIERFMELIN